MLSFTLNPRGAVATAVRVSADELIVELADGRTVTVPVSWFPRLANGTPEERSHWEPVGGGEGIHWPDLDEDIRVASLLEGRASGESQESLQKWLADRSQKV
jgi:hypothetical protein